MCGFKEQPRRGRSHHTSLGLVAGPPQMWTIVSLVGISESVFERRQSQRELGDTVFVAGEEHPWGPPPQVP